MPPAVAAAGIVAAGSIGGAILGGRSQSHAAGQAADAEREAAQLNVDAAREFRAENTANFQPWLQSGGRANSMIDSFLYGPGPTNYYTGQMPPGAQTTATPTPTTPTAHATQPQTNPGQRVAPATYGSATDGHRMSRFNMEDLAQPTMGPLAPSDRMHLSHGNMLLGSGTAGNGGGGAPGGVTAPPPATGGAAGQSPFSGYAAFINSPYYQFGQQEGMKALNTGLASRGMIESGDAIKSAVRYGQDYGYSQGLMPYLGMLGQQSDRGVQSAGAIAGVGVNALNSISQSNTAAGNATANAQLARGAANAGMYAGIGNALGSAAGSIFGGMGSSFRPGGY